MSMSRKMLGGWRALTMVAICGTVLAGIGLQAVARPPRAKADRDSQTEKGTIERFTKAPHGDVDGAVLADGTVIHWPPHVGERVANLVAKGDRIKVVGRTETGPEGDTHFEAQTITNLQSDKSLDVANYPPPGPDEREVRGKQTPNRADMRTVEGKVRRFSTAPRGEVDGAVLDDGTVVHWPPHMQNQFKEVLDKGDRVRASGWMETGPEGDTHLEVRNLTNLESNASVVTEDAGQRSKRSNGRSDRDERIEALQKQLDQMQKALDQLRREQ